MTTHSNRRELGLAAVACLLLAGLSLIPLSQVTGPDPNAWMSWSYGLIHHGTIDFGFGPSWKPLPVIVTAPLNLFDPGFTAGVWLLLERFAAFWCSAMLFILVRRDGGNLTGGIVAALLPFTIRPWVNTIIVGESESIALGLVLTALFVFLNGRSRLTTLLLTLAGLLRPETWPLLGLQLFWRRRQRAERTGVDAAIALLTIVFFWFAAPQLVKAGGTPLAMNGGYSLKDATLHTIFSNVLGVMPPKAWVLIPVGVVGALLARRTAPLMLAAGAGMLIIEITLLWALHPPITAAGYTPVLRYFAVAGVMLCGVAGAGAGEMLNRTQGAVRFVAAAAVAILVSAAVWTSIPGSRSAIDRSRASGQSSQQAVEAIARAGGIGRLQACEPLVISNWSAIGWSISRRLGIPLGSISTKPHTPSVALDFTVGGWVLRTPPPANPSGRRLLATYGPWEVIYYPGAGSCLPR